VSVHNWVNVWTTRLIAGRLLPTPGGGQ
jgi:hypothetical protein